MGIGGGGAGFLAGLLIFILLRKDFPGPMEVGCKERGKGWW